MNYISSYLLALAALVFGLWLPGYGLLRLLGLPRGQPGDRLGELVLGLGYWIAGLFALASLGLLHQPGVLSLMLVAGALALAGRRGVAPPAEPPRPVEEGLELWGTLPRLLFLLAFLGPFFLLAASPLVSWDADVYHLALPRLYLEAEGFRPVEMSVYSNWPLGVQLLFALALLVKDYVLAKLLHFAFGLGVLYALAVAARRAGKPVAGWLAGLLFLANPVVTQELRVAYVDLAHAFVFTLCLLFVHRALESARDGGKGEGGWLLLAGIAGGLLAGIKITGLVGAVAVGALLLPRLVASWRGGALGVVARPVLLRFALPCLLLPLPWLAKAAWATGNPVYPFLGKAFPIPDWSVELGWRFTNWQSSIGMGREAVDYLLLPIRVILRGGRGYGSFDGQLGAFWIVALPLALLLVWKGADGSQRLARRSLAVSGLFFCAWAASSQQMRFLIPILPAMALASALALTSLTTKLRPAWRGAYNWLLWAGAAILLLTPNLSYLKGGARLFRVYAEEGERVKDTVIPPVFRYVNEHLSAEAKILMLNTNRGFFCRREYLADSFFEASQVADWLRSGGETEVQDLRQKLAAKEITHVLMERRDWGIAYPPALGELSRDPEVSRIVFRSEDGRHTLWELH